MSKGQTMSTDSEVELGDLVKDYITGFEGIAIGITDWLYGCKRLTIQPRGVRNGNDKFEQGKPLEAQTFDIDGVEIIEKSAVPTSHRQPKRSTGGPRPDPLRTGHNLSP